MTDSDDDGFLNQSVFDESSEIIAKGDLVWAPFKPDPEKDEEVFWPAQVTSVKCSDTMVVKMLGKSCRAVKVTGCLPYTSNSQYEEKCKSLDRWENAVAEVKRIMDLETNGIIKRKLIPSTPSTSNDCSPGHKNRGKRRKLARPRNHAGFVEGDIVWAKYRNHPIWPAQVTARQQRFLMIHYLECGEISIRTDLKNVAPFDCPDYVGNVEAGINSVMSATFKLAYTYAYDLYAAERLEEEETVPLIPVYCNGTGEKTEPVSPQKGKNQLVRFINRSQDIFVKIAQGKLVAHYHAKFKENNYGVQEQSALLGSYSKTDLEEYQIVTAIGQMQTKLPKRLKLPLSYGISVMLPEAIIRLIMSKKQLSYVKAKETYEADRNKVKRKEKQRAHEALRNTPIEEESKLRHAEITNLKIQKTLKGKGRKKK